MQFTRDYIYAYEQVSIKVEGNSLGLRCGLGAETRAQAASQREENPPRGRVECIALSKRCVNRKKSDTAYRL